MNSIRSAANLALQASLLASLLAGCSTPPNHVVFVTKTSLGLDVDTTPPTASLAYDRVEGYVGPRFASGHVPPVAASFATNGQLFGREIRQVYATGNAARIVTGNNAPMPAPPAEDYTGTHELMHFGTGTVLGIKLGFGAAGVESFTLGYKRKEASVIPMTQKGLPSVLANLDTTAEAKTASDTALGIEQFFATGVAADQLAGNKRIQKEFEDHAIDALAQYRTDERQQSRFALGVLDCLARVDDSELGKIWQHAESLALFDDKSIPGRLRAQPAKAARALYTREIAILTPKSPAHTANLQNHRGHVCNLANQ